MLLLFTLFIQPMSQWIRQRQDIKGVAMASGEQKLALFADHLLISLTHTTTHTDTPKPDEITRGIWV